MTKRIDCKIQFTVRTLRELNWTLWSGYRVEFNFKRKQRKTYKLPSEMYRNPYKFSPEISH